MKMGRLSIIFATMALISCQCAPPSAEDRPAGQTSSQTEEPGGSHSFCYVSDGILYSPEGQALSLWGVNFQTPLSWEANRLAKAGVPVTGDGLNSVTDSNLDDVILMGATLLRCHLTPADFTDAKGNLTDSPFLDALDYLTARADEKGLYVSYALLNHMGQSGPGKAWAGKGAKTWIHDPDVVACTKNYIRQLLEHRNKYNGKKYCEMENLAFWELINEPQMLSYSEIASSAYADGYRQWLKGKGMSDTAASYKAYRSETVRTYIDGMAELIRETGDRHPICWGLNWHRYRNGNEDIFEGVAASRADMVAFCNYPGQDYVEQDYSNYRYDFTGKSFADWFNKYGKQENGYAWTRSKPFAGKAVIAYEFETFFNQSAYLYPIQSLFIKSLRGQAASMWTYTFREIAPNFGGSHFLNLRCTPGKAASFQVARRIFEACPYGQEITVSDEMKDSRWCISKAHDAAVYCDSEYYCHSGETLSGWSGIEPAKTVRHICGLGPSRLVSYSGSGVYFIDETREGLEIRLMPDVEVVGDRFIKGDGKTCVTRLTDQVSHPLDIYLSSWENASATLYQIRSGERHLIAEISGSKGLSLQPGHYILIKK